MSIRGAVVAILLMTSGAFAGPFGLDMGMSRQAAGAGDVNPNGFSPLSEVPARHPSLVIYSGKFAERTGLCVIVAASKDFENDRYGEEVRAAFENIRSQIDGAYGPSKLFDYLRSSALWDDPDEWVMAIRQNERSFQASWDHASGARLKDGIVEILLTVRAFDSTTSDFALQYRFENDDQCDEEIASEGQSVL